MTDDIRRWSDELARDPSSLVFLQLGGGAAPAGADRTSRSRSRCAGSSGIRERRRARSPGAHRRRPPRFRARVRRVGHRAAPRAGPPRRDEGTRLRVLSAGPVRRRRAISQRRGGAGRRRRCLRRRSTRCGESSVETAATASTPSPSRADRKVALRRPAGGGTADGAAPRRRTATCSADCISTPTATTSRRRSARS